jgi:hypothetical protein
VLTSISTPPDPEDSIDLTYKIEANDSVSMQCSVKNIYPLPEVKLLWVHFCFKLSQKIHWKLPWLSNLRFDNEERKEFHFETDTKLEEELYDITVSTQILKSELKDESPVSCLVSIPNSDYSKRETITYDGMKNLIFTER